MKIYDKEQKKILEFFSPLNFEYLESKEVIIFANTGIPAYTTEIKSKKNKNGFAQVFDMAEQVWRYVEDHRGKDYFSTINGAKFEIKELGEPPEDATNQPRPSIFHKWNGKAWIEDQYVKNEAYKQQLNNELAELKQDMIFANMMGDDTTEFVKRVNEIRDELKTLD